MSRAEFELCIVAESWASCGWGQGSADNADRRTGFLRGSKWARDQLYQGGVELVDNGR